MDEGLRAAVASTYPLGPIRACERFDRDSCSVVRIDTGERVYWLKLLTCTQPTLDTLESEAEVASELAERGVRVAAAVRRRDGRYAGTLLLAGRDVSALLFDESPGIEVNEPSLAQAEALGTLLGQFHAAAVSAGQRRWRIDAETIGRAPLRAMEVWLQRAGGDIARELTPRVAMLEPLVNEMIDIAWPDSASLPTGLCHGDVQLENVRFEGKSPTLFDLEVCGMGPWAYDLACYWRRRIILTNAEPPRQEWAALLRGYEQTRRLSPLERRAIPALAALRAVWVMAMPAAPGVMWGQDWIDGEYIDGHHEMIERFARTARAVAASE